MEMPADFEGYFEDVNETEEQRRERQQRIDAGEEEEPEQPEQQLGNAADLGDNDEAVNERLWDEEEDGPDDGAAADDGVEGETETGGRADTQLLAAQCPLLRDPPQARFDPGTLVETLLRPCQVALYTPLHTPVQVGRI